MNRTLPKIDEALDLAEDYVGGVTEEARLIEALSDEVYRLRAVADGPDDGRPASADAVHVVAVSAFLLLFFLMIAITKAVECIR